MAHKIIRGQSKQIRNRVRKAKLLSKHSVEDHNETSAKREQLLALLKSQKQGVLIWMGA